MTCDFIDAGYRCGKEESVEIDFYHPDHLNHVGEPESPFPLQLCEEHREEKITWNMIMENNEMLIRGEQH